MDLNYTPPPVLNEFMRSDAKIRLVRGPVGSAKSTACAMELFRRACEVPPCMHDGVRRSKMVISRATLQQLKTTCLVTIRQFLQPIMHWKVSESTIQIRFNNVESDWILLPLDTEENIERLLSLELTWGWISEFREIKPEIVQGLYSRCGRYPSRKMLAPEFHDYDYGVIAETNSFSEDSEWYEKLEVNLPENWEYFVQPGAFEPNAENRENLPPRYYEDMVLANDAAWVEQYVHNKITPSLSGQAVFKESFITDFHVAPGDLHPIPDNPLIIGMDTGRQPAAIVGQMDAHGRLLILAEAWRKNMGVDTFLETVLMPLLQSDRLAHLSAYLVIDPQCIAKGELGEESVLMMSKRLGFQAIPASTNNINPRLRAVDKYLNAQRSGGPAILFDPHGVPTLIKCMQSMYRYKIKKKDKSLEEKPSKDHPWSDLADALQYLCLGTDVRLRGKITRMLGKGREEADASQRRIVSSGGWT